MTRNYSLRASGTLAGEFCTVKKCPHYGRFAVSAMIEGNAPIPTCAVHLANVVKGFMAMERSAVAVQEIPGNWLSNGSEKAVIQGEVVTLRPAQRRD